MSGYTLRRTRERLGWSQTQMGETIGVSRRTILRWEKGQWPVAADKIELIRRLK